MSAFVCILRRDGADLDPRQLDHLAAGLDGPGETATLCRGPLGVAVRRRPGGEGDRGEGGRRHGPFADPVSGRVAAVAGHPAPVVGSAERAEVAAGAAAALGERGDDALLAASSGSFALLVADPAGGRVRLAGDRLGSLAVHYLLDRHRLIAATDPAVLLRHEAVSSEPDEATVAAFLGFRSAPAGRSFFRHLRVLPPAHRLEVTADEESVEQTWRFHRLPREPERSEEEVAGELLRRLAEAVAAALAGTDPGRVGLALSGGLDSTAVAAVAPRGVRAFSWTFEEAPEADERARIEAVARHLGLPLTWVPGDGLHPLAGDFAERFVDAGSPVVNPFAALRCRLLETARAAGCEWVLVGDGGDALYAAREHWLRDLVAHRRPGALGNLAGTLRRAARGDRLARAALGRLLPFDGPWRARRRHPPWLTAAGRALLPPEAPSPILPPGPGGARFELAVGAHHAALESEERRLFERCGVERANPFWSWPLLEWAIQLPAWWYHRGDLTKPLARAALRGRLPEAVLEGPRGGLLGGFFLRGIERRRPELRETVFRRPRSDWQRYVRREWVEPYLEQTGSIAFGHTILWRVICYELWQRRLAGSG